MRGRWRSVDKAIGGRLRLIDLSIYYVLSCVRFRYHMKIETIWPLHKGARTLQNRKDESLKSFQWCLLRIAHNYPLLSTDNKMFT